MFAQSFATRNSASGGERATGISCSRLWRKSSATPKHRRSLQTSPRCSSTLVRCPQRPSRTRSWPVEWSEMSKSQRAAGHTYYAAISLHNGAIAAFAAGRASDAVRLCNGALETFELFAVPPSERYSTHAVLATCWFEIGRPEPGGGAFSLALSSGQEHGDVHAEFAYMYSLVGSRERAEQHLVSADSLFREGLSDLQGATTGQYRPRIHVHGHKPRGIATCFGSAAFRPASGCRHTLSHQALQCLGRLLAGRPAEVLPIAEAAIENARLYAARPAEVRLAIAIALAKEDETSLRAAIRDAASVGNLALLEMADAIGASLALMPSLPEELKASMRRWPAALAASLEATTFCRTVTKWSRCGFGS